METMRNGSEEREVRNCVEVDDKRKDIDDKQATEISKDSQSANVIHDQ